MRVLLSNKSPKYHFNPVRIAPFCLFILYIPFHIRSGCYVYSSCKFHIPFTNCDIDIPCHFRIPFADCDAFLTIKCEGEVVKSGVVRNCLNPVWNTKVIFYRKQPSVPITIEVRLKKYF